MRLDLQRRSLFTLELEHSAPVLQPVPPPKIRPAGEVINGRYRVLAAVGEGGMGRVYRVEDALHPERALALKMLAPTFMQAAREDLFKAEFHTMSELAHPHIARVYDFETVAGGADPVFTMEYVDGRDLLAASEGQPLERIVEWTVQACRALHYLHSRGVVHADFKPHNVLVTPSGNVKVLDFGLSGAVGAGWILGTAAYMAPELSRGRPADARADLYALGVSLYQLMFRRTPFGGASLEELVEQHARAALRFPAERPAMPALEAVLARLCEKDPEQRFQSANEVIAALGEAMGRSYAPETEETRRSYLASGRLVGRETETQRLLSYCLARSAGREHDALAAAISGPSGVGKSRLVRELRKQLQLVGVSFVEAACYEGGFGELEPLRQWSEAVRSLCRAHGRESLEARHAATLEWLRADGTSAPRGRAEEERLSRLRDLAELMLELSRTVGLVLHVGDLQWARTATTDFLRVLCERQAVGREAGEPGRLALLISYRDDEVDGRPLQDLLAAVPSRLAVPLAPLDAAQTAELIGAMLGARLPDVFAERVARETGGNPFFIEEVLRALMERGDVHLQAGSWTARAEPAHLELPESIAAVLERRLSAPSLPPAARELLDWLSVYAQPMLPALLAEVSGLGEPVELVRQLVARGMVTQLEGGLRTAHDKLREFLYARLADAARRDKHLRIARAIDRAGDRAGEHVYQRAHHYWHAGDREQAYRWAEAAAELAERSFATDVAIDNCERLRVLCAERGEEAKRRRVTDKLLKLCAMAGQYQRIVSLTAAELGSRDSRVEQARLHQLAGEALGGQGKLVAAIERLREVTVLLGGRVPRGKNARRLFIAWHYLRHVATLRLRSGDLQSPAPLDEEERQRREILGWCYLHMSIYALLSGDDEGFGLGFAGINAALPLGRCEVTRRLLQNVSLGHHLLGRFGESRRLFVEARRMAESEADHALLLTIAVLCRQATQRAIDPEARPIHAYEAEMIRAVDLLSTRGKALFAHMARTVATVVVWQYAPRFRHRPEVARWAEAMHGTVHFGFVQGAAAVLAHLDGQTRRAAEAYALAQAGNTTPFYRAWVDVNFAWVCAITGDTAQAVRSLRLVAEALGGLETRTATALPVPALAAATCITLHARGISEPWMQRCLEEAVARLERVGRRLAPVIRLVREAGRIALRRSTVGALGEARRASLAAWEGSIVGHPDAMMVAALALRASSSPECRAAAPAWAAEALRLIDGRFPERYLAEVRALLSG